MAMIQDTDLGGKILDGRAMALADGISDPVCVYVCMREIVCECVYVCLYT